jgi:hypothetical protein
MMPSGSVADLLTVEVIGETLRRMGLISKDEQFSTHPLPRFPAAARKSTCSPQTNRAAAGMGACRGAPSGPARHG